MGHLVAKQNALKCLRLNTLGGVGCPGKEASAVLLETVVSAVATSGAAGSQTVNHSGDPHEGKFSVETLETAALRLASVESFCAVGTPEIAISLF